MDNLKKIRQYQSPSTSTINYVTPAPPLPPRRSSPITLSGQSCERYVQRIEWFEVAILDEFFPSLVQPQTKKHWHLYRKSASHEGGMEEAQLEEMFEAMLVLPQA